MKRLFILTLFVLLLLALQAAPVNLSEARAIAAGWMSQIASANTISAVTPVCSSGQNDIPDLYVINFAQGGFLLMSGDDKAAPVLGFDTVNNFGTADQPDNLAWFIANLQAEINVLRTTPSVDVNPDWRAVRNGDFTGLLLMRPVSPLLQTTWDQGWPYNSMCPSDAQGPGGHVYAGCGATTMGQIMKYWAYPTQGVGSHSYNHSTYGVQSANFGATTYNWASMPNSLWFNPNTNISTLLYHCGVALDMDYAPDGSGSYVTSVRPAFVNYFAFETTAQTVYKSSFTTANWEALMRTELDAARPIFYVGTDTSAGGHAWVCDGYSGTNYFHMNWGWSGSSNGYFYLSNLNPSGYAFNSNQGAVIGLRPTAPIAAPTNLVATVDADNMIFLEWQNPLSRALLGYTIYRNGVICGSNTDPNNTNYFDINLAAGTYSYYVVANFSQGDSQPSNTVSATVYPAPVINYQEGFELFSDFTATLFPWFGYDLDNAPTASLDGVDFPGEGSPQSFIVFNPNTTTPPLTDIVPMNGSRVIACLPSVGVANDDWFVTPKWNTGNVARMRFWARSAFADSGLAKIQVGVSAASPDPSGMNLISGIQPLSVPETWTCYDYTLTSYTFSNVFAGVHCLTDNGSLLLIDRFQLWSSFVENEDAAASPALQNGLSVYPNPFRQSATLSWNAKTAGNSVLNIYDLKGRLVNTLTQNSKSAGAQSLLWNATDLNGRPVSAGIYFARVQTADGNLHTQKLVLLK